MSQSPLTPAERRQMAMSNVPPIRRSREVSKKYIDKYLNTFPASTPLLASLDYGGPIVRHLAYHIMPWAGKGTWESNLDQLKQRLHLFNGRRRMAIVTDPNCDHPDRVKKYLYGLGFEFVIKPNAPKLREVATFVDLMAPLASSNPNEVVFYAHAKGVRHSPITDEGTTVHRWASAQYETCLDDWATVETALLNHAFAGSFKRYGQFTTPGNHRWHYSGTFYWIRSAFVFTRPWQQLDRRFFGVESWPGKMGPVSWGYCLFGDRAGDLYRMEVFDREVQPALEQWRCARQNRSITVLSTTSSQESCVGLPQ